jgi:TonB family protein
LIVLVIYLLSFWMNKHILVQTLLQMLKKATFGILICMIFSLAAKAQKNTSSHTQKAIRYNMKVYENLEIPIRSKDSADFSRIIFPPDSTDNLFLVNDFYKNGKLKMVGKIIVPDPNISLQGASIEFFPNGEKKTERNFENNKHVGDLTEYFPNGKIYITGKYVPKDGVIKEYNVGKGNTDYHYTYNKLVIIECRDSTGKIQAKNGNGYYIKYGEDFKEISKGNIVNGVEDGEWQGMVNESISYTCIYDKGILQNGTCYDSKGKEYPFTDMKIAPSFNGGGEQFFKFFKRNFHYPDAAKKNNIQGKVYITFIVDTDGRLSDFEIVKGLGYGCDEEVLKLMKKSPPWLPAYQYGIPVRTQYAMPVSFALQNDY